MYELGAAGMKNIDRETFSEIIELITPLVNTQQSQQQLVQLAFYDAPGLEAQIQIGMPARTFATLTLRKAIDYGTLPNGTPAPAAMLDAILQGETVGLEKSNRVRAIIAEIKGEPITPAPANGQASPVVEYVELPEATVDPAQEHIFISYSSVDRHGFVERYAKDLKDAGYKVWVDNLSPDYGGLEIGRSWQRELANAVAKAAVVNVVLTPESVQSKWVHAEVRRARQLSKPVYPVMVREIRDNTAEAALKAMNIDDLQRLNLAKIGYDASFNALLEHLKRRGIPKLA
jgi:hypothetical protein